MTELRAIGKTEIKVTPVAMGCWPITGITSVDVNEASSLKTLESALYSGINFFDTAYCYGYEGESERMIGRALGHRRDDIVIATKGGIHWKDRVQQKDGRPETIKRQCEESLTRLNTDRVELYYHHAPDPDVPVAETAIAFRELLDSGKVLSVGVSNYNVEQLAEFAAICPLSAFQPHFNMLQREIEEAEVPWCIENSVSVMVYWPLMKGLLAGKLPRKHKFDPKDGRQKYPMFQGDEWHKNQDFIDVLRVIASEVGRSVADVVINWTIHRRGIDVALCGAKRPEQIQETAGAMNWKLSDEHTEAINQAIAERGPVVSRSAVRS